MNKTNKVLELALEEIKPSKEDEKKTKKKINTMLKKLSRIKNAKAILAAQGRKEHF